MNTPFSYNAMRRNNRPGARSSNGFALVEVLMALLLFSIGILGLLGLQARAVSTAGDAEDRNRAALIADQCASQMQLLSGNVTITGTGANTAANLTGICKDWDVSTPAGGGLSNGKITVTPVTPTPYTTVSGGVPPLAPVTVDITVTWCPPARAGASAGTCTSQSRLSTRTTLLVLNK